MMQRDIRPLKTQHTCIYKAPIVTHIDMRIFEISYYTQCMSCNFCHDWCCSHGVDIDITNVQRLNLVSDKLELYTGTDSKDWFTLEWREDKDFPGGRHTRITTVKNKCIFLSKKGRGCSIHSFCLEQGIDYHYLKPMVSILFPLTFDNGLLQPSDEVKDNSLVCLNQGLSLYEGIKTELLYYFGQLFIDELDELCERSKAKD